MRPIGVIRSEFTEKFGIPKQPNLAPALQATIVLQGEAAHETYWRGLTECSHLWVIFLFHQSEPFHGGTVRPPVLGGDKRVGVFATRSPHRPNPLGLSLVKRAALAQYGAETHIQVEGHDFLDGTPVLDLKPYVSSYDVPTGEVYHWSEQVAQKVWEVRWETALPEQSLKEKIEQVIKLDPRPRSKPDGEFGLSLAGHNVVFAEVDGLFVIKSVTPGLQRIK